MKSSLGMALVLALLSTYGTPAVAQKLYKWVDEKGNVHYSDKVPPDQAGQARQELNEQGIVVKEVDRARTPEELAAYKEKLRQEAEAARQAEAQRKRDESLLASYANEDDIKRAFSQRTELIEQQIESSKLDIDMRTKSLDTMVTRAAESERAGRKVSDALKATIEGERAHIERQRAYIVEKQAEKAATEKEYQETLNAYRTARARLEAPRSPNAGNDPSQR